MKLIPFSCLRSLLVKIKYFYFIKIFSSIMTVARAAHKNKPFEVDYGFYLI